MITLNERIKKLRRSLDLTQQGFAEKIGTARNNIAGYETGKRSPSEAVISLICKTFNVNEEWLRTGAGEMFVPREEDALSELVRQRGLSFSDRVLVEKFLDLKPESRQAVIDYMEKVVAALSQDEPAPAVQAMTPADTGGGAQPCYYVPTDEDIDRDVEEYRRRLLLEKRQEVTPSPLSADDATA